MQIAGTVRRHIYEHMPRNTAHSDHTSCMLDRIIRINELCSDTAHFRTLTHSKHFFQPVRIDGFYIIIQEKQIFSLCMRRSKVIDGRIIKFFFPANDSNLRIFLQFFVICKNFLRSAVILYNDDLIILIFCFFFYGCNARMKCFFLIFIRNDDRNKRLSMDPDTVRGKIRDPVYVLLFPLYRCVSDVLQSHACLLQMHTSCLQDYLQ